MAKYIIETVQVVKTVYYAEVENPEWAHDGITMGELDPFASEFMSEDIFNTREVEEFPKMDKSTVNAAVMKFNYTTEQWDSTARWDLAE